MFTAPLKRFLSFSIIPEKKVHTLHVLDKALFSSDYTNTNQPQHIYLHNSSGRIDPPKKKKKIK